jgi:glycosyltransferase involved in cell wall biosynthesis
MSDNSFPTTDHIRKPKVSIVCAWYNRADYICDTIDSLLSQDFPDFEIVLVDDGSTDTRVKHILDGYKDDRLRIIHQVNSGFVSTIRRAIDESSGEYVAIQGAGDISLSNRISCQISEMENGGYVGTGGWLKETYVFRDGAEKEKGKFRRSENFLSIKDFMAQDNPLTHGEVMFRRDAYEQVGGYRKEFKFAQDRDLWLRMAEVGNFGVVKQYIYIRRSFETDGVSANIEKSILQKKFSVFARQLSAQRLKTGNDWIDRLGSQGLLFYRGNRDTSKYIIRATIRSIVAKDLEKAALLFRYTDSEPIGTKGKLVKLILELSSKNSQIFIFFAEAISILQKSKDFIRWRLFTGRAAP